MTTNVSVAVPATAAVGEGPSWDASRDELLWVDIATASVFRSALREGRTAQIRGQGSVGAVSPARDGGLVVATARGVGIVDGDAIRERVSLVRPGQRTNDAKCDPAGRFWVGTTDLAFKPQAGALHVVGPDWSTRAALTGLTLPNGLGWSPDGETFYLVDSAEGHLLAFDFRVEDGELQRPRVLVEFPAGDGVPDGLSVDGDGCLWIAIWGGGRIERISPDGERLLRLDVGVPQPTSCAFGGRPLDRLFVTTAAVGVDPDGVSGSVLEVSGTGARGLQTQAFAGSTVFAPGGSASP